MPETKAEKEARLRKELKVRRRQAPRIRARIMRDRPRLAAVRRRAKKVRAAIMKLNQPEGVRIQGNTATGGTPRQRLVAVAREAARLDSTGKRKSFYSQPGKWTVNYAITGEPAGYRSDCSQWVTSVYKSAGLPDPNKNNYAGGWTGTLASAGRRVSASQAQPGDLVMWDPYRTAGHVEMLIDPKTGETIGHGSRPVDRANVRDFAYKGEPQYYTYL